MRRDASGVILHPLRQPLWSCLEHIAQPTDGSTIGMEEEMRGNLWEHSDEWLLRRAHAPAWAAPLIRKSGSPEAARGDVATACALRIVQMV